MSDSPPVTAAYELVIGLEVHVQLNTRTKLFCNCAVTFGEEPNTRVCPTCLGLPGALPVANMRAFELAVTAALALDCEVAPRCAFDRKSYDYPDLPKNYQISQFDQPLATGGRVMIDIDGGLTREIPVERLQLEEDAGKMLHDEGGARVDFNRAGTPLIEIVGAPALHRPDEATRYLRELRRMLRALRVSDCEMEQGSMRCDCNVSVRPVGAEELGARCEIKNLNSFRAVERAAAFEGERQWALICDGEPVPPETRLWDEDTERTLPMRRKEAVQDYRYFPEPDLPPIRVDREYLTHLRSELAELPRARRGRFVRQYDLPQDDALTLCQTPAIAEYFEAVVAGCQQADARTAANWIRRDVLRYLNEHNVAIDAYPITAAKLAQLLDLFAAGRLNRTMTRTAMREMAERGITADDAARELGPRITGDHELARLCDQVISDNEQAAVAYRDGKTGAIKTLVGEVMRATDGKADAQRAGELLKEQLKRP